MSFNLARGCIGGSSYTDAKSICSDLFSGVTTIYGAGANFRSRPSPHSFLGFLQLLKAPGPRDLASAA